MSEFEKPDCPLIGADGNVFNLIVLAAKALKKNGMLEKAKEMSDKVFASGSYDEALCIITEYVNHVSAEEMRNTGFTQSF